MPSLSFKEHDSNITIEAASGKWTLDFDKASGVIKFWKVSAFHRTLMEDFMNGLRCEIPPSVCIIIQLSHLEWTSNGMTKTFDCS